MAEASAAAAEQLSIAATQDALAFSAQASSLEFQAAGETLLAQAAQAQADYYADLAENPPSTFEQTLFVYDLSGHLIGEYGVDGSLKVEYAWLEDMPLAQLRPDSSVFSGTAVYWYQVDHLNTPTQLTDSAKQVVWDAVREPFGKTEAITSTVTNNLRFPGQYQDAETGLHYNYFRDYDTSTGRYIESDPIGLRGGFNPYRYSNAAPTRFSDPTGQVVIADDVVIGAAVLIVGCAITPACTQGINDAATGISDWMFSKPPRVNDPEALREWKSYKDKYDEPPPPNLDECEMLRWQLKREQELLAARQAWDAKWGPHHVMANLQSLNAIRALQEKMKKAGCAC